MLNNLRAKQTRKFDQNLVTRFCRVFATDNKEKTETKVTGQVLTVVDVVERQKTDDSVIRDSQKETNREKAGVSGRKIGLLE